MLAVLKLRSIIRSPRSCDPPRQIVMSELSRVSETGIYSSLHLHRIVQASVQVGSRCCAVIRAHGSAAYRLLHRRVPSSTLPFSSLS